MLISRIKQLYLYLFGKYKKLYDEEVKKILSQKEFEIFCSMPNYDKLHSYNLLKKVENNSLLSEKKIYKKLALLHDCGKGNIGLFRRVKKVLIGDKLLEQHSKNSFNLLKEINKELAHLALIHHEKARDKFMKEFQFLDDK
ncbi:MAG: HD domain-containing protein [Fusobacterium sp.]|nr:HD domain-containing protein [Fusobacterium sp.]